MIEGRRLLPFYREALSRDRDTVPDLTDCNRCRHGDAERGRPARSKEDRQKMGCGYERPIAIAKRSMVFTHPGYPRALGEPTTCIGYTGKFPVVLESDVLLGHVELGTLDHKLGGAPAPDFVVDTMADLRWSEDAAESWRNAKKMQEIEQRNRSRGAR